MRWAHYLFGAAFIAAGIAAVMALAVTACSGGDCSCAPFGPGTLIESPADDLVSASGCGKSTTCGTSCGSLRLPPPPDGGACTVTITFADGGQTNVTVDFGAAHPPDCCGTYYDNSYPTVTVHADAGSVSDSAAD